MNTALDQEAFRLMAEEDAKLRKKCKPLLYEKYTQHPHVFYESYEPPIKRIVIDIETYSAVELSKTGVYRYAEDPSFEILLFGYSVNGGHVNVVDMTQGEQIPEEILSALLDPGIIKHAFKASFERICLSRHLRDLGMLKEGYIPPRGWHCDMVWAGYMGFPMSLKLAGMALGLEKQKMDEGKELITYFCKPYRATSKNGYSDRNLPEQNAIRWFFFKMYNQRDVEVEMEIANKLKNHPVPDFVWEEYCLDQEINDRGILVDFEVMESAIRLDAEAQSRLKEEMQEMTQLENPKSVIQLQQWLKMNGVELDSLGRKELQKELENIPEPMRTVLKLRLQLAMSAVTKYKAMKAAVCADGRLHGMFKFYGGSRTGRFSGAIVQLQNLFRNSLPDLELARELVKQGNYDALRILYDSVPEVLAQCVRTAFIPAEGMKFIVADFSAIECRVLAWLAGEQWVLDVFKVGGDIYCESASRMFHVPVEKHGANGELRQKGKQAVLSCIAEGQLVLTDKGLIPIEDITTEMQVWDGGEWVSHDGVVFQGEREVITYEGLTATPDHLVYIEGASRPIRFDIAASSGAHLVQTGDGRNAIWLGKNNKSGETMESKTKRLLCFNAMSRMRSGSMATFRQSKNREIKRLSKLYSAKVNSILARAKTCSGQTTMRESERSKILELWRKRDQVRFSECNRSRALFNSKLRDTEQGSGTRSYRQQWRLYSREYSLCYKERELRKQTNNCIKSIRAEILAICGIRSQKQVIPRINQGRDYSRSRISGIGKTEALEINKRTLRVYDILNARRHHRFTVSGKLVHNCGYGGSVGALRSMGAIEAGMKEEELQPLVTSWRKANPNIVKLWHVIEKAVKEAIKKKCTTQTNGLIFCYQGGMLYITLPSGRNLSYVRPRIAENRFGGESISYYGNDFAGHWSLIESFGGKLAENIVQAISRDILCHAMELLRSSRIVAHIHDEVVLEVPMDADVEEICRIMATAPVWAPGLPLRADGYECKFYKKD